MKIIKAAEKMTNQIVGVIHSAIKEIYPEYYPVEIVKFFLSLHCFDNVLTDVKKNKTIVAVNNENIIATGTADGNHITRVYVLPKFQKQGVGSKIMDVLENTVKADGFDNAILDASSPAFEMYLKRGYKCKKTEQYKVTEEVTLQYEVMEKLL